MGGAVGLGGSVLCDQRPGSLDRMEPYDEGRTPETHCPEPSVSAAGRNEAHPNLTSRILAAAVRVLPQQWEEHFGYRPLLAETFTDIEQFHGTCYKAAGWEPVGMSKGYSRHRADFYLRSLKPPPVGRLRRVYLHLLCSMATNLSSYYFTHVPPFVPSCRTIIGKTHDDHVSLPLASSPLLHPQL